MKLLHSIRQFFQERLFLYRVYFTNSALRHPRAAKTLA